MTTSNQTKGPDQTPDQVTGEFSWDSLPEVAKERWEEMVAYSSTVEKQLSKAKASRSQAEAERQRIASETLNATKDACRAVVADSKRAITKLKSQVTETDENFAESRRQLAQALSIRNEADAYRESTVASVEKQAQEILQKATHAAEIECARLRKQASLESYQLLAQAEAMRAAAQEELEAQKIYSEAAMLKADAYEALGQLQARLDDSDDSLEDAFRSAGNEGSLNGSPANGLVTGLEGSQDTGSLSADGGGDNPTGEEAGAVVTAEKAADPDQQETIARANSKSGSKANREKAA